MVCLVLNLLHMLFDHGATVLFQQLLLLMCVTGAERYVKPEWGPGRQPEKFVVSLFVVCSNAGFKIAKKALILR